MLTQEQQQLYSCESAQPRGSNAKAARHTDAEEKGKLQKFNILIQKSKVLFMFALRTRDTSDFAQLNFIENYISNFSLQK